MLPWVALLPSCMLSHLHALWKKKTWVVWPINTHKPCEANCVPEAVYDCLYPEVKDGRCTPAP